MTLAMITRSKPNVAVATKPYYQRKTNGQRIQRTIPISSRAKASPKAEAC
jgi:hypothetical protein